MNGLKTPFSVRRSSASFPRPIPTPVRMTRPPEEYPVKIALQVGALAMVNWLPRVQVGEPEVEYAPSMLKVADPP